MDLTNLSHLHALSDEDPIETVEPDIGASWDAQAWDEIFDTLEDESDEEVTAS